ncbi:MAG TPA: hypothetical protein VM582_04120 [Candidatus Thermoplasmatota archaeon]|nr:hypothetical protein [Candidatus Thermoplasmatota archaeon]
MRLLPILVLTGLAGCAAPEAPEPAAAHAVEWALAPGAARELNVEMGAGERIAYRLDASAPVAWDIHSHDDNGRVTTHASGVGRAAEGSFEAPADDTYSIFARAAEGAHVRVDIEGRFRLAE